MEGKRLFKFGMYFINYFGIFVILLISLELLPNNPLSLPISIIQFYFRFSFFIAFAIVVINIFASVTENMPRSTAIILSVVNLAMPAIFYIICYAIAMMHSV